MMRKQIYIVALLLGILVLQAYSAETRPYMSMSSILLPGSGQFLIGHRVKGVAFALAEGVALGMAYNEDATYTQWHNAERRRALDSADALAAAAALLASDTAQEAVIRFKSASKDLGGARHYARLAEGSYRNSLQLRNMELLWAGGIYVYNMMDAIEKGLLRPDDSKKNPRTAVLLSSFLPGAGQVYNGSLGKAGMIWMVQGSLAASALYRHDLMRYYESQIADLNAAVLDSATIERQRRDFESNRNSARRKRNSFIWYSLGFYFYNVFDALVDAHLHDFDRNMDISIIPQADGMRIAGVFPLRDKSSRKKQGLKGFGFGNGNSDSHF